VYVCVCLGSLLARHTMAGRKTVAFRDGPRRATLYSLVKGREEGAEGG